VTPVAGQSAPFAAAALDASVAGARRSPAGVGNDGDFALKLMDSRRGETPETAEERARLGAEQLVAISFVEPILSMVRESDNAAPPFKPTRAEKQFRALLDADLAQRIVRGANFPLVGRLARQMLQASPAPQEAAPRIDTAA